MQARRGNQAKRRTDGQQDKARPRGRNDCLAQQRNDLGLLPPQVQPGS
jgi:hypothetical protein